MAWSLLTVVSIAQTALFFLMPTAVWFFFKPSLLNEKERENDKYELNRLKNNEEVFSAVMARQKQIDTNTTGLGITLGNPNAKNTLIKVCNPYCDPCSKAHPEVESLTKENIKVQIIYFASTFEGDITIHPVKHFLAIAAQGNDAFTIKVLSEWYADKNKNIEKFRVKYPALLETSNERIEAMHNWCNMNAVTFTPTYFFNGRQLPSYYKLSDIKHFLPKTLPNNNKELANLN